ncbi:MAG: glycosyltransferase family 4 protein [Phycisphaerales bacterium]
MRILHISTRLILGGSQENTVLSCEGQAERGHEVHLAFGPIYGPEGSLLDRVREFETTDGRRIETHPLPNMVRELSPRRDRAALRECRELIRSVRPDIVHTHSSKAGILGRAAAWREGGRRGRPGVVHTIHGLPFHPYETKRRNAIYILSERWAAKRCHRIVSVCDAMTRQALAAGVGRSSQFVTVYSGMETERFLDPGVSSIEMREALSLDADDFVIGTVARLAELKGHDDLLDALSADLRANPNWKLLWVGDGWWTERLMQQVEELGLQAQVIHTGLVPPEEVPQLMAAMDVLVHPSYREGLPRTLPQALLSGVPVIAYNLDGAPEVCIDGETGRLVEPGDHESLRHAVEWMAAHPAERRQMAERGRDLCRDRFSANRMVEDLDGVYASIVADRSGAIP